MKTTAGAWITRKQYTSGTWSIVSLLGKVVIGKGFQSESDAVLASAAPDLRQALELLMDDHKHMVKWEFNWTDSQENDPTWIKCKNALKKATGQI